MLKARVIPCLLLKEEGLVKTENFKNPTYIGDPVNAVKLFNEKEADELILLDIDATANDKGMYSSFSRVYVLLYPTAIFFFQSFYSVRS